MCLRESLLERVKLLSEAVWEGRIDDQSLDAWLGNFRTADGDEDAEAELHALYLLSHFIYFGNRQMRELMRVLYRDIYRYPIVESIRRQNGDTTDAGDIHRRFAEALNKTLFLGVGNPSESGCHLLYYFRQENGLSKERFIHTHRILTRQAANEEAGAAVSLSLRYPDVDRYVFIDDFCGSGHQGREYSRDIVEEIKSLNPLAEVSYFVLVATQKGMSVLKQDTRFDRVACVFELDSSFKCFSPESRYFPYEGIDIGKVRQLCERHGQQLVPAAPLGYGDCQLLLGFHHNTPDNTLPIFWYDEPGGVRWSPVFRRYPKIYAA